MNCLFSSLFCEITVNLHHTSDIHKHTLTYLLNTFCLCDCDGFRCLTKTSISSLIKKKLPSVFSLLLNYSADIQSAGFWLSKKDEAEEIMSRENGMQFLPGIFWPE